MFVTPEQNAELQKLYQEMDFQVEYTENLPAVFSRLNISLALTSYQASKLILVRSDEKQLDVSYKTFYRPMGLAVSENGIVLGAFEQVINFQREDALLEMLKTPLVPIEDDETAPRLEQDNSTQDEVRDKYIEGLYKPADSRTDACYIARSSHYTGMINIHDIAWGNEGLWAVNTSFSCLCTLEPGYSFVPRWKPWFISELLPEDRCHLNGMAMKNGEPAYVTTFSQHSSEGKWRQAGLLNGTLIDVKENRILFDDLIMPHSPRYYEGAVYFCESGTGLIYRYDESTGMREIFAEVPGFVRGMDFYGPLMFVGLSRVRVSNVEEPLPLTSKYEETCSGVWVFNLINKTLVGKVLFSGTVDQIYDVAVVPGCRYPELIEPVNPRMRNHFSFPDLE